MMFPQQAAGYLELNRTEALPAFALTSYGAVASPFLSAASCRVSWRRRMEGRNRPIPPHFKREVQVKDISNTF
jgi:hypothetical protein